MKIIHLPCQVRAVLFSVLWLIEHSPAAICNGVERLGVDAMSWWIDIQLVMELNGTVEIC